MTYHVRADVLIQAINSSYTFIIEENTLRLGNLIPAILSFDIKMSFPVGIFPTNVDATVTFLCPSIKQALGPYSCQ